MPQYKVVAPLVALKVRDATGALINQHFYAGALVPDTVDPENLRAHLDTAQVAELGSPESALGSPAGTPLPGRPPNVPVTENGLSGQPLPPFEDAMLSAVAELPAEDVGDDAPDVEEPPQAGEFGRPLTAFEQADQPGGSRPHGNASQPVWAEYHVGQLQAQGSTEDEARAQVEGMSRDDIRALYK